MVKEDRLEILYEDNHLLVINKPAGLATQGVAEGLPSVAESARQYLKREYHKPGNVYIGIVSRLDALVTGVLVLARTSKAAARLTEQFKDRTAEKTYLTLVRKAPDPREGELLHWVVKDEGSQKMTVVTQRTRGALQAHLAYRTLEERPGRALLQIQLYTGRKHQIRLQLAAVGSPIVGDRKYGSREAFPEGIALHAARLSLDHPTTKERMTFEAPLPRTWQSP